MPGNAPLDIGPEAVGLSIGVRDMAVAQLPAPDGGQTARTFILGDGISVIFEAPGEDDRHDVGITLADGRAPVYEQIASCSVMGEATIAAPGDHPRGRGIIIPTGTLGKIMDTVRHSEPHFRPLNWSAAIRVARRTRPRPAVDTDYIRTFIGSLREATAEA